jgi:D-arabinose 1-dehydrogenase-like Zn-dependent alcohol dehydrogenase
MLMVAQTRKDLLAVTELCEAGKIVPAIDRLYALEELPEAMRYVGDGSAKGKVVITVSGGSTD